MSAPLSKRPRCEGCGLLGAHCVCSAMSVIDNDTPVRILQHPNEAGHALNTARWVERGLHDARVLVRQTFSPEDWTVPGHTPLLLYPDAAGQASAPLPPGPHVLVVLDGTWRQAATLLRTHPTLQAMARLALPAACPTAQTSAYRLRKAPRPDSRATVEAVAAALDMLDAPRRHDALLRPFTLQIERQIARQRELMGEAAFRRNYPDLVDD